MSARQPAENAGRGAGDMQEGQLTASCEDRMQERVPSGSHMLERARCDVMGVYRNPRFSQKGSLGS